MFAGIPRNSLDFNKVKDIFNGSKIESINPARFYKSLNNLEIDIKSSKTFVSKRHSKPLIDNNYIPNHINSSGDYDSYDSKKYANKLTKNLKYRHKQNKNPFMIII